MDVRQEALPESWRRGLNGLATPALKEIADAHERAVSDYDAGDTMWAQPRETMAAIASMARTLISEREAAKANGEVRLYLVGFGGGSMRRAMQRLVGPWMPQRPRLSRRAAR